MSEPLKPLDLTAIRGRVDAATPGEWKWDEPENWYGTAARVYRDTGTSYDPISQVNVAGWPRKIGRANAVFIAHARSDVPALLAEVERLRGLVEKYTPVVASLRELTGRKIYAGVDEPMYERARTALAALPETP